MPEAAFVIYFCGIMISTAGVMQNKKGFRNNRKPEAGVVRIELTSKVLETPILPLNHTPMSCVFSTIIIIPHNIAVFNKILHVVKKNSFVKNYASLRLNSIHKKGHPPKWAAPEKRK